MVKSRGIKDDGLLIKGGGFVLQPLEERRGIKNKDFKRSIFLCFSLLLIFSLSSFFMSFCTNVFFPLSSQRILKRRGIHIKLITAKTSRFLFIISSLANKGELFKGTKYLSKYFLHNRIWNNFAGPFHNGLSAQAMA